MAIKRSAGTKGRGRNVNRAKSKRDDGLSTTPTQYGERSPDYVKQAGDPDFLKSYSEEQIGLMGGRERVIQLASESEARAAARAGSAEGETAEVGAVAFDEVGTVDEPISMNEGPTTAPTTYGSPGKSGSSGKANAPGQVKKKTGVGSAVGKGNLTRRIAKTTGTTRKEGRGVMKRVRKQVRRGNTAGARRTLTRALSGGPRGGVAGSRSRTQKARATSRKVTTRIQKRQAASVPMQRRTTRAAAPTKRRKK